MGIVHVNGAGYCTAGDAERFFSYRRDGVTGRMASLIWLEQRL
jgi:copper oxidase (laccase) domain-containing protein